ncbi:MAG: YfgG family protein [Rouxiella aceris]|uniref:YfgG family protein n=1 Tax=Rouxiella aceris TaxID=2703884 RepID=UPI002848E9BE|nr:YfgG family protein [Rouxiella aceris]MDR3430570.1 YfgG family protein [Rouxiella aceris]
MAKIVLTISFIILPGRFIYATIGSYSRQKSQKQVKTEQSIAPINQENHQKNQTDNAF